MPKQFVRDPKREIELSQERQTPVRPAAIIAEVLQQNNGTSSVCLANQILELILQGNTWTAMPLSLQCEVVFPKLPWAQLRVMALAAKNNTLKLNSDEILSPWAQAEACRLFIVEKFPKGESK